ncbi:hypothetical protein ACFL1Q_02880 [Patescibacteria group bacterium]
MVESDVPINGGNTAGFDESDNNQGYNGQKQGSKPGSRVRCDIIPGCDKVNTSRCDILVCMRGDIKNAKMLDDWCA